MQEFGGIWTKNKLDAVENYLAAYEKVMKNQNFKLCYIDAFSGSGNIVLKDGEITDGSTLRALKYSFDKYYFFDINKKNCDVLSQKIDYSFPNKQERISIKNDDCNEFLMKIDKYNWYGNKWRGVIFLDPYAMNLTWTCLEKINNTKAFDIWYLFPFSAVNRNLYKNGKIPQANKKRLTDIFGADDWEQHIYKESAQLTLIDEPDLEKVNTEELKQYIIERLQGTFYTVSPKAALLRNENNAPLFLLCFAGSNRSPQAKGTSLKIANHILENI